uniref:Abhp n=1 Tax=Exaiptasia diaphana TaxID=2652724 RepID=Q3HLW5_EXADI|nr:abhp [Exaiptasia diaphana]
MPPIIPDYDDASMDVRKMKSPDEKLALDLAKDLIQWKIGKRNLLNSKTACLLRKLSTQIEQKHEALFKNLCNRLDLNERNVTETCGQIADELIGNDINWGRIVVLYTFGAKVAEHFHENGTDLSDEISKWIGNYMAKKSDWIRKAGGWVSLNEH